MKKSHPMAKNFKVSWIQIGFGLLVILYELLNLKWVLEFTTAHAFITGDSIAESQFKNYVFPLPAGENWQEIGRTYVSYPVITFLLAGILSITSINIQLLTYLLGLLQLAYIIYAINRITEFGGSKFHPHLKFIFLIPAVIVLSPGNFYFFTHIFYGDMFAITICFALIHTLTLQRNTFRRLNIVILVYVGCLTEFLFSFFLIILLASVLFAQLNKKLKSQIELSKSDFLMLIGSFVTALSTNIYLYQKNIGLDKLVSILSDRRQDRGQTEDPHLIFVMARGFFNWNLGRNVFLLVLFIAFFLFVWFIITKFLSVGRMLDEKPKTIELSALGITTLTLSFASLFHTLVFQNLFINHFFLITKFVIIAALVLQLALRSILTFYSIHSKKFNESISSLIILGRGLVLAFFVFCSVSYSNHYKVAFDFASDPNNVNAELLGSFASQLPSDKICLSRIGFEPMPEIQRQVLLFPPLHYYSGKKEFFWSDELNGCIKIESVTPEGNFRYVFTKN